MSKWFTLMIGLCIHVLANAQTPQLWLVRKDTSYFQTHAVVMLRGGGGLGSNVLDNGFVNKLVFGGHIDLSMKDRQLNRMNADPRAGLDALGGIQFFNMRDSLFGRHDLGLTIEVATEYAGYASFQKNAFQTMFYGNAWSENQQVSLGPLYAEFQSFQKFSVGVFSKRNWSSLSVGLVSGNSLSHIAVSKANMYSSSDSLKLNMSGEYFRSDATKTGLGTSNGIGLAVDFNANVPLAEGNGLVSLTIRNLGFISWNASTSYSSFNSGSSWTGLESERMFDFNTDSLSFDALKDSLHLEESKQGKWRPLPTSIQFRFLKPINQVWFYELGCFIRPNLANRPLGYAALAQKIGDRFFLREHVSLGGYTTWQAGAEVQWFWANGNGFLSIGSAHIPGFISKQALSRDIRFSLAYFFKRSTSADGEGNLPID